ncbi:hypothetical protein HPB51_020278 [Rhipicephalus microplus]|uniref:Armadillo-like helical domain-containing protein n=1 Tax=Rhipicephalus microplus TaxID=6941 RepID=A0A9J6DC55_RHIMP|nr:hypothetical protein HPB51_020278 [Rhipicephalus microplus]
MRSRDVDDTASAELTLCALIQGVYRKSHGDYGFDIINLLIGFDMAETTMQELIELIRGFLEGDYSHSLKSLVLRFLLVLVTVAGSNPSCDGCISDGGGNVVDVAQILVHVKEPQATENVSNNTLLEYVMMNCVFEAILQSQTESCATATAPTSGAASPTEHSPHDLVPVDVNTMDQPPSNLLVTFLEFCSIVMQKTKVEANANTTKLGFIILTCITEDQYANSMMHDVNMVFKVQLHRMPMRHRKVTPLRDVHSRPLACALLDLMVEFIFSHMKKNLLIDLYQRCLGVIHRLLCYQKKCRVRLQYSWKELWTSLISLLKFLLSRESDFVKKHDIFQLASQVVNIFNLFITYGDTFLPSPGSYDELYYEVIRMHQVFDSMYSMALRYTTGDSQWKDSAAKLSNHLVNVRAIVNHFTPKIDSWSAANHMSALTEKQVLDVVRSNYDTLTLKLHDNLDQYEKYSEKPKESPFFTLMIRNVVSDFRQKLTRSGLGQENVLKEFSTIA